MTWFANWFDSDYYHLLYKERDEKEAQLFIDNILSYLKIPTKSSILDIACGKGRHSIYFNQRGMNVTGIDLSLNSINIAKINENKTLRFAVHDMRETYKENNFDVVTNLFTSFGYFKNEKEEQKSINAMALNLKKGGILIIDFMNVKKVIKKLVKSEKKKIDNITFNITRNIKKRQIIKDIKFSENGNNYHFQERVKTLNLTDFSKFIFNAGLKIIDIFGDYNMKKFNAQKSERLIIICKK